MNKTGKIIGLLVLFGGGAYGLSRLLKAANTGKKVSVNIANVNKPTTSAGALVLSINVVVDNPTDHTLSLQKPYVWVFYNGKEVGNSIPTKEVKPIKANDRTTINDITVQIPFIKLGTMALSLISGKAQKMAFDILVKVVADGIPYTDKQHFEL